MTTNTLRLPMKAISQFCSRWNVAEFSLFGSILRSDFNPTSDVDVLIAFAPKTSPSLFEFVQMKSDLERIFNRPVDLVEKTSLTNPYRRQEILESARLIYAS